MTLTNTALETHPNGTAGLNEIVNGNWERLEELFTPGLSGADPGYLAFAKAILREAMSGMVNGETIVWTGSKFTRRAPISTLTYAATTDINFLSGGAAGIRTLSLTGDVTFTTSNLAAGQTMEIAITADGSSRNFTFPGSWVFVGGSAPASIAASKKAILRLTSTSTADSGVIATYLVQP
jgi:hypothetical protein